MGPHPLERVGRNERDLIPRVEETLLSFPEPDRTVHHRAVGAAVLKEDLQPGLTHHSVLSQGAVYLAVPVGQELMGRVVRPFRLVGGWRKVNVRLLRPSKHIFVENVCER